MFCEVRRSSARISRALCCLRASERERERERERENFFSTISFALRQFRASAVQKRIPCELWYFAHNTSRCFLLPSIDVATPPLPRCFSLSTPLLFCYPPTTRVRSTISSPCSTRPTWTTTTITILSFPLLLFFFLFPATSAETLVPFPLAMTILPPPVLFQPRKSKLDAKTRPNVHNARRSTYRVSGTITDGHRFPPSGRNKSEDMLGENVRRPLRCSTALKAG